MAQTSKWGRDPRESWKGKPSGGLSMKSSAKRKVVVAMLIGGLLAWYAADSRNSREEEPALASMSPNRVVGAAPYPVPVSIEQILKGAAR
jgi:hypothetical protein